MKIQVGIHTDVIIQKADFNDKGRFVVFLRKLGEQQEKQEDDPFAQMNAAEVVEKESGGGIIFWPFKAPDEKDNKGNVRTTQERGELANNDVSRLKNQLQLILEQYMTKDKIHWSIFDGAAMSKETYWDDIVSQANLDVIYRNICEQFMGMIQPYLDKDEYPMRWKLARQSKEKHYARVPDMYIKDNPFIEPMEVPEANTRVKWTKYELDNGLNDGTPVSRATADPVEDAPEGDNAFGQR